MKPHIHYFKFECDSSCNHKHIMNNYTQNMIGVKAFHFHFYSGISCYNSHSHYFSGITGLGIKTENGHVHKLEGCLEDNNLHEHTFGSLTFEEIEYIPGGRLKEALE